MLTPELCYRALRTRDRRFDGRFFVAVRSTGVFCRPICPARTPRRENCWFVPSAAAAREAGYRPCLRCRPEAAPGSPAWAGTSATVARALRLIDAGALEEGDVEALASRLGVGARHLRRLFTQQLGASPRAVAQTRRLLFAKKLIDETALALVDVATTAGFASVRRFNDAVRRAYGRPPGELRRRARRAPGPPDSDAVQRGRSELTLRLGCRPPLAFDELLAFLAPRTIPRVECVQDGSYHRAVQIDGVPGHVSVRPAPDADGLDARVGLAAPASLGGLVGRLRRLFDLDADPLAIAEQLASDPVLAPALAAHPGRRVPGAWDGFELAVRAILGQQVSVRGATTLAGRLVERFGLPCASGAEKLVDRVFPSPEQLAHARIESIGLPATRAAAIRALAGAVASQQIVLDGSADPEATCAALEALPGIGPWTTAYVAMRALGEPDAFPSADLGLRRALAGPAGLPSPRALGERAEAWRPWRAYAALHLWQSDTRAPVAALRSPALRSRPWRSGCRAAPDDARNRG